MITRYPVLRFARFSIVPLALVVAALPAAASYSEVFQQSYRLPMGGTFSLSNVNGSVRVEGWEGSTVEIHAVKSTAERRTDLDLVQIDVSTAPGSVRVVTRYPEAEGADVRVEYFVRVPYRVALRQVTTVNGVVRVRGVEGSGTLAAINGDVEVSDSAGGFSARTTNGNVRLELRDLPRAGEMTIETVNGYVFLAIPATSGADLDVRSVTGEFRSELPISVPGSLSREFRGRIGRGGGTVRIRTVNGGIQLAIARVTV